MCISQHESRDENQAAERVAPLNPRMRNMTARRIDMMLANIFLTRETILFCDWFGILGSQRASPSYSSSFAATGYYLVILFPS